MIRSDITQGSATRLHYNDINKDPQ